MAAEHLLALGHVHLAHISGPLRLQLSRERQEGFVATLREHGLETATIESAGWNCQNGYDAMSMLLLRGARPTALFAANDRNAIGAMLAAFETGLRVPDDLSVIGLDDIEPAAFHIPPLTTIRQSFSLLGTKGAKLLIDLINGQAKSVMDLVIDPELIIRKSTAQPGTNEFAGRRLFN
jgi:LacI family transcriptional regulator